MREMKCMKFKSTRQSRVNVDSYKRQINILWSSGWSSCRFFMTTAMYVTEGVTVWVNSKQFHNVITRSPRIVGILQQMIFLAKRSCANLSQGGGVTTKIAAKAVLIARLIFMIIPPCYETVALKLKVFVLYVLCNKPCNVTV